jgi:hypothetical protein
MKKTSPTTVKTTPAPSTIAAQATLLVTKSPSSSPTKPTPEKKHYPHFVVLLAILSAYLYLVGYLYQSGFLYAVGLDTDLYSRSVDGYITKAFFPIMSAVEIALPHFSRIYALILAVIGLSLVMFLIVYVLIKLIDRSARLSKRLTVMANSTDSPIGQAIGFLILAGLTTAAVPTVLMLVLALLILPAHKSGNAAAHQEIAAFVSAGGCTAKPVEKHTTLPCVELKAENGGKTLAQGLLLASSDKAVAIYDPVAGVTRSFVLDKGMTLERKYVAPNIKP